VNLDLIQRTMLHAVRQPLTPGEQMRKTSLDGESMRETAEQIIKPNDRLTSFERLEIYNRQYWFRVISSMADDFEGLRAIVGEKQFHNMVVAYLIDCPSKSFTMRNLGYKLEEWLGSHRELIAGLEDIALDMVKVEWAEIEVYDGEACPPLTAEDLPQLGPDPVLRLQPYLRLLELEYPLHELLLKIREQQRDGDQIRRIPRRSLPKPNKTYLAVHRLENSVYYKTVDSRAFAMLKGLGDGKAISEAAEAVEWGELSLDEIGAEVQGWFANWTSLGWFCR
jgi:hypothetical protein